MAGGRFGTYPGTPPKRGSIMFTQHDGLYHTNELNLRRLPELLRATEAIHKDYGGDLNRLLGSICLILADMPVEPLLNADPARKASVVGMAATAFLLHHPDYKERAMRIARSGKGVMLL